MLVDKKKKKMQARRCKFINVMSKVSNAFSTYISLLAIGEFRRL